MYPQESTEISLSNMEKEKKLRAALAGVMQYLIEEREKNNQKNTHKWTDEGRKLIMQNHIVVQRRSVKW